MGLKVSKAAKNDSPESPESSDNVFISYYCEHLVNQKINVQTPIRKAEIESFKNVYNFRKNSIKKDISLTTKNKI